MTSPSRRSIISGVLGAAGINILASPYIARAEATTTAVWIKQGFVRPEDEAFRRTVADYETASGNKLDYNIMPFMALSQKVIAAPTSGTEVPDLIFHDAPATILPQNAWIMNWRMSATWWWWRTKTSSRRRLSQRLPSITVRPDSEATI